ncbi:Uncharacterised protein [Acinetobacter baumannii]|nr:Uncharacterised protein [Acinetobacter baumannii]SSS40104.1 Uncharacterised protein [Acinetobacter baumannii]SSS42700.1 Uncharacterised protein [Acinetobacter baumannii]SSU18307.1 Uncharacterised protein [Acinetobacter baumannii]SSU45674.1 Uncharacterised protein [Acinetobacter baumannii]
MHRQLNLYQQVVLQVPGLHLSESHGHATTHGTDACFSSDC